MASPLHPLVHLHLGLTLTPVIELQEVRRFPSPCIPSSACWPQPPRMFIFMHAHQMCPRSRDCCCETFCSTRTRGSTPRILHGQNSFRKKVLYEYSRLLASLVLNGAILPLPQSAFSWRGTQRSTETKGGRVARCPRELLEFSPTSIQSTVGCFDRG